MEKIRTFIAIELSEEVKEGLAELQEKLKGKAPQGTVRWVRPEGIHLTLKFLGNIPSNMLDRIKKALTEACEGFSSFSFSVRGLGCFPSSKRPRVIWVGVEEKTGMLLRLQEAIEEKLALLGFPPEKREFSPHLTLGRTHRRASGGEIRKLGELIESTNVGEVGEAVANSVSLMRSDLKPAGAVYTRLAEVKLRGE
jgi:2'-5' RNA ligase